MALALNRFAVSFAFSRAILFFGVEGPCSDMCESEMMRDEGMCDDDEKSMIKRYDVWFFCEYLFPDFLWCY